MTQPVSSTGSFTLEVDGSLFSMGFVVGIVLGKFALRNTLLAVAFAMGLGLAVGTSPRLQQRLERAD